MAFSPLGAALARRIAGQKVNEGELASLREEVADLQVELDEVRARLGHMDELQERLDFAERLLAQQRPREALPGGS